jgi:putative resolvase
MRAAECWAARRRGGRFGFRPCSPAGPVIYAWVSRHDRRADLDREVSRLAVWASDRTLMVRQVGSVAMADARRYARILSDPGAMLIVVEHRDRLTHFGVEQPKAALPARGHRIVVAGPAETTDDLVRDLIDVLTPMCARLYARRGARNRAMRVLPAAEHGSGEAA